MERIATAIVLLGTVGGLAGCSAPDDTGTRTDVPTDRSGGDGDVGGEVPVDDCAEGLKLIYVLDEDSTLYSFDPRIDGMAAFHEIGSVNCASGGGPNSMAVSRDGYAYALFGQYDPFFGTWQCLGVNRVALDTAACLGSTPFACGSDGFDKFGMGYATDTPGSTVETLFLGDSTDARLGTLDIPIGTTREIGALPEQGGEFTGNAEGELWGFFPYLVPPAVIQIAQDTGAEVRRFDLPTLDSMSTAEGGEWAFAYFGHAFYIFYSVQPRDTSTNVYRLDYDGTVTVRTPDTGMHIVGAGVSTCAPIVLI